MSNLEIRSVRKHFGRVEVIHGVDLCVRDGEFIVFVGPSGCGKSTLLRMIAGLEDTSSGEIHIAGRDVTDLDPAQRGIAMVFQSYALYPHMTVRRNMGFGLKMGGMPANEVEARVHSAAGVLKLDKLLDRKPRELSGGQRQRVAIGRAIVREPEVFLFDEPLSNLDAELRVQMRLEISKLHQELKATMIYVTHDQVEAMTLADRIVVLRDGRVEQVGPPQLLYDDPDNAFVAGFIGSPKMNFLPAEVLGAGNHRATVGVQALGGHVLEVATRSAGLAVGARCTLGFRPEHTVVVAGGGAARVRLVETLGSVFHIYAETGDQQIVAEGRASSLPAPDDEVSIRPEAARSFLFGEDGVRQ